MRNSDTETLGILLDKFDAWFKTTPYFTGENCSPKYETYRIARKAYLKGISDMVDIVYEDVACDDFGNSIFTDSSLTHEIVYHDNLFRS